MYFVSRVASGGDANNDGFDDVFVIDDGLEKDGTILGRWFMYSGKDSSLLWSGAGTEPTIDRFDFACEFADDLDGEGCDEIILGRPGLLEEHGGVDVLSGAHR